MTERPAPAETNTSAPSSELVLRLTADITISLPSECVGRLRPDTPQEAARRAAELEWAQAAFRRQMSQPCSHPQKPAVAAAETAVSAESELQNVVPLKPQQVRHIGQAAFLANWPQCRAVGMWFGDSDGPDVLDSFHR